MFSEIYRILCCPDDSSEIILKNNYLECTKCYRHFLIYGYNLVEILPSKFPKWNLKENENKKAEESYQNIFVEKFSWDKKVGGWGDLLTSPHGYRAFVKRERERILELLNPSNNSTAIDISGGVGNYSIFLSDFVKAMIHCELHVPSIITAYNRKKDNMIFVRSPYLKLPFISDTFDYVICTDTLERGWNCEVKLLREITRIMKIGGKAIVDFHNLKWFRKNRNICAYKAGSIRKLLHEAGIKQFSLYPFGYVPTKLVFKESLYPYLDNLFRFLFPPKRHIVVFTKAQDNSV